MTDLTTPCEPWPRCVATSTGYGRTNDQRWAHRVVYEANYGSIPPGMHVGHACHDADLTCPGGNTCAHRACVNPHHLVLQTPAENVAAGVWGRRQECANGHPYDETNTYRKPNGRRDCRACKRERMRGYKAVRRLAEIEKREPNERTAARCDICGDLDQVARDDVGRGTLLRCATCRYKGRDLR